MKSIPDLTQQQTALHQGVGLYSNSESKRLKKAIDNLLQMYKTDETTTPGWVKDRAETIKAEIVHYYYLQVVKLRQAKYPNSSSDSIEYKKLGEMQKSRAFSLIEKNINLIKEIVNSESDSKDFAFTLMESVFSSDRPETDKNRLNETYKRLMDSTGATEYKTNLSEANLLQRQIDTIIEHSPETKDEFFTNVNKDIQVIELDVARRNEMDRSKPVYKKYVEIIPDA